LLRLFVLRNFRGACSSVDMLKGYMVRKRLGTPVLGCSKEARGQYADARLSCRDCQSRKIFPTCYRFPIPRLIALHGRRAQFHLKTISSMAGACQASPLRARVGLEIMMSKGYSSFLQTPEMQHHITDRKGRHAQECPTWLLNRRILGTALFASNFRLSFSIHDRNDLSLKLYHTLQLYICVSSASQFLRNG